MIVVFKQRGMDGQGTHFYIFLNTSFGWNVLLAGGSVETLILKSTDRRLQCIDMCVNFCEGEIRKVQGASVSFIL